MQLQLGVSLGDTVYTFMHSCLRSGFALVDLELDGQKTREYMLVHHFRLNVQDSKNRLLNVRQTN